MPRKQTQIRKSRTKSMRRRTVGRRSRRRNNMFDLKKKKSRTVVRRKRKGEGGGSRKRTKRMGGNLMDFLKHDPMNIDNKYEMIKKMMKNNYDKDFETMKNSLALKYKELNINSEDKDTDFKTFIEDNANVLKSDTTPYYSNDLNKILNQLRHDWATDMLNESVEGKHQILNQDLLGNTDFQRHRKQTIKEFEKDMGRVPLEGLNVILTNDSMIKFHKDPNNGSWQLWRIFASLLFEISIDELIDKMRINAPEGMDEKEVEDNLNIIRGELQKNSNTTQLLSLGNIKTTLLNVYEKEKEKKEDGKEKKDIDKVSSLAVMHSVFNNPNLKKVDVIQVERSVWNYLYTILKDNINNFQVSKKILLNKLTNKSPLLNRATQNENDKFVEEIYDSTEASVAAEATEAAGESKSIKDIMSFLMKPYEVQYPGIAAVGLTKESEIDITFDKLGDEQKKKLPFDFFIDHLEEPSEEPSASSQIQRSARRSARMGIGKRSNIKAPPPPPTTPPPAPTTPPPAPRPIPPAPTTPPPT